MSDKIYVNILKYGVVASLFTVFLVFKSLLFPFITSKQISFNILIEILMIFWLALIIKYPEYRPRKSFISFGLLAFFGALILSCFVSVDFNLSFWGDIERMLGVFHLLHFLALYFFIITVFRSWKDWQLFFVSSIVISVFLSIYGLSQNIQYSTLGNTEYVAAYLIFNIYFCLLLFFSEDNKALRWVYLLPLPILLWQFDVANISGAYVGLGFSIIVLTFLYAFLSKHKKIKIALGASFIAIILLTVVLFIYKDKDFVKNSSIFGPITEISIQKNTFQTRLISWRAAFLDFKNHPILGTGYGNFSITFDKYFDPVFYNHTRGETYFDKAHNNVIEIGSTTGMLGLLTYLSIFLALAYYLIGGYYKKTISLHEFVLISCLLVAYFVQNLAVFDSLSTYITFMMVLAYVYWLHTSRSEQNVAEKKNINTTENHSFDNKEIITLAVSSVLLLIVAYQYNIKVWQMLSTTIEGQKAYAQGRVDDTIEFYKKAFSYNTILDRDSRSSFVNIFAGNPMILNNVTADKRQEVLDFVIETAEANVQYNKQDSLMQMILAQVYNVAATYNIPNGDSQGNAQNFYYYSDKALRAIDASIEASPRRIPIYFQKAQFLLTRGEKEKAIETLKYAENLNPDYPDSFCYLGRAYLLLNQSKEGYEEIGKCLDLAVGSDVLNSAQLVRGDYLKHFEEAKDWPRVIRLYEILTGLEKNNAENWVKLANLYKEKGDNEKAKIAAEEAIKINPGLANYAGDFIDSLK